MGAALRAIDGRLEVGRRDGCKVGEVVGLFSCEVGKVVGLLGRKVGEVVGLRGDKVDFLVENVGAVLGFSEKFFEA